MDAVDLSADPSGRIPPDLRDWLRLLETPGVGRSSARRLLAAFGTPTAVFEASPSVWRGVVAAPIAQGLEAPPRDLDRLLARTQAWLAQADDRHLILLGDPAYPAGLLELADPPLLLYAEGDLARLTGPALAMVGSRNPSAQGLANARAFGADFSRAGVVVVSGLAAGIDGAAHEGALQGEAGTVAVLGTGLDLIYPRRHAELAARVRAQGLLLSEYALGTPPVAAHFPLRNRIIAGLSLGTLVVEAALQSGSLITARLALEAGREVFAIPGSIHSPHAKGCHALIKQGAKLVEDSRDILDELPQLRSHRAGADAARRLREATASGSAPSRRIDDPADAARADAGGDPADPADVADVADPVLAALGWSPATLEVLQLRCGLSASDLSVRLLELELLGEVARLPGQLFQRQARG